MYLKLFVEVSAFTQFVDLSLSYNIGYDVQMNALPSMGNSEQVCVEMNNTFLLQVANAGPFFQVFDEASAQTLVLTGGTLVSVRAPLSRSDLPYLHSSSHAK